MNASQRLIKLPNGRFVKEESIDLFNERGDKLDSKLLSELLESYHQQFTLSREELEGKINKTLEQVADDLPLKWLLASNIADALMGYVPKEEKKQSKFRWYANKTQHKTREEAEKEEWIEISEKGLPIYENNEKEYLVAGEKFSTVDKLFKYFDEKTGDEKCGFTLANITHWRPLPEPPKV